VPCGARLATPDPCGLLFADRCKSLGCCPRAAGSASRRSQSRCRNHRSAEYALAKIERSQHPSERPKRVIDSACAMQFRSQLVGRFEPVFGKLRHDKQLTHLNPSGRERRIHRGSYNARCAASRSWPAATGGRETTGARPPCREHNNAQMPQELSQATALRRYRFKRMGLPWSATHGRDQRTTDVGNVYISPDAACPEADKTLTNQCFRSCGTRLAKLLGTTAIRRAQNL